MLDTAQATRIRTAAHSQNIKLASHEIKVYDWRIHHWIEAQQESLTDYADHAEVKCADDTLVRARTLTNNTLDVRVATPGASITWSANTITQNAKFGFGVALYVNGQTVDAFFVDSSDSKTIKTRRGTVGGGTITWGAASTVVTASTQYSNARIFLAAPDVDIVFYTDSPTSNASNICIALKSGGVWSASTWDFAPIDMGVSGIEIYGIGLAPTGIAAIKLGTGDYNIIFYAKEPNGATATGLWQCRVSNVIAGQTPHWQHVYPLFSNTPSTVDPTTNQPVSRLYVGFPKVQQIGSEFWIAALEVSAFAGHYIQHLAVMRSRNGTDWTDRNFYLGGSDWSFWRSAVQIPFWINKLFCAQPVVVGNYIYLVAYDAVYRTDATILCGVDNAAKRIDVTGDVKSWDYDRQSGGQAGQGTLELANPLAYDSNILRKGARIVIRAGYFTTQGEELMDVWTGSIDEISKPYAAQEGVRATIAYRDLTKLLTDDGYTADVFYSFYGPEIVNLPTIYSTSPFYFPNGSFSLAGGILYGGLVVDDLPNVDNLAVLTTQPAHDGFMILKFDCRQSWTNAYAGIVFQLKDETNYYVIIANGTDIRLYRADPTAENANKNLTYTQLGSTAAAALSINTVYYLRVRVWHGTLAVEYSSDQQNWTAVSLGSYGTLPTDATNWGIVQKGNVSISPPIGEARLKNTNLTPWRGLNDENMLNPVSPGAYMQYLARVKTGKGGALRSIAIQLQRVIDLEHNAAYIPSMTVRFVKDKGDASFCASMADLANVLYETTIDSSIVPIALQSTKVVVTGELIDLEPETYYWVYIKSNGRIPAKTDNSSLITQPVYIGHIDLAGLPSVSDPYRCFWNYYETPDGSESDWQLQPISLCVAVYTAYDSSGVEIQGVLHSSGETYKTIEDVATGIAAKAGQLQVTPDSKFTDDFDAAFAKWDEANAVGTWVVAASRLSGYNSDPNAWAFITAVTTTTLGDVLWRSIMQFKANGLAAGLLLRATGSPSVFTKSYLLYLASSSSGNGFFKLSKIINGVITPLTSVPAMVKIPVGVDFRVTFTHRVGMFAAHVNDCLVGMVNASAITTPGAIGLAAYGNNAGGSVAEWDSVRVPDLDSPVTTFAFEIGENAGSALKRLVGDNQADWFSRNDGALRIGSMQMPLSLDTYDSTMLSGNETESDREWFNHVRPTGDNVQNADRFDAELLEAEALRRFRIQSFANAASDEDAYARAAEPIKRGRELTKTGSLEHPAVLVNEPRDRVTVANELLSTSEDYVIDSINVRCEVGQNDITLTETLNWHLLVAG
ncbi:MAG: hypothetical protein HZB51_34120 [Chloroflexi bacterium]|nr:hypothetical protein [Chloroflexota bacterium]